MSVGGVLLPVGSRSARPCDTTVVAAPVPAPTLRPGLRLPWRADKGGSRTACSSLAGRVSSTTLQVSRGNYDHSEQ